MPFGLTNAPASFQRAMDILFSPFRRKSCLVYLDDIIIFSKTWEEHVDHVDQILRILKKAGVKLKLRKCEFFVERIKYLGHIVRPGTIEIDLARMSALKEMGHPQNQTQLRSFLGMCNVYRRFFPGYARIAHPLDKLLKKGQPVLLKPFDEACATAFETLKSSVLSPPILALPKQGLHYSLDTDVSDYQIGEALFKTHPDGFRKPIGFFSRTLAAAERNYSVSEKECLAVVWAVQTLRPYLYGEHFLVHTDHSSLRWLLNVTDQSGRLIRWRLRLSEYDFEVVCKKCKANTQADALSRLPTTIETVEPIDDEIPCFTTVERTRLMGYLDTLVNMVNMPKYSDDEESDSEDDEYCGHAYNVLALEGGRPLVSNSNRLSRLKSCCENSHPTGTANLFVHV